MFIQLYHRDYRVLGEFASGSKGVLHATNIVVALTAERSIKLIESGEVKVTR
jgi:hypothetical protein